MSGDKYDCEKCGEDIYTHCDCGLPSFETESELRRQLSKAQADLKLAVAILEEISTMDCGDGDYIEDEAREALSKIKEGER